uniref:Uncharacterized protein n=1 Tax=Rhizophagus irregularis (strain DAOM 181602 / DAOM 197198 / MUCL 43194) TaxID=747089 RepID=U9T9E2_RHIID
MDCYYMIFLNTTEEIEIINVGKEGMSYGELKRLHSMSMLTLSNMSKVISSLPSTSTSTSSSPTNPITLYSSKNVKISKTNNNWLIPYYPYIWIAFLLILVYLINLRIIDIAI